MVYADEVNDAKEIPEIADLEDVTLTKKELDMARQLIASLEADFDAEKFEDTYRNQVLDLIERKAAGEDGDRRAARGDERGQGRRPDGRPRGERQGGQGGAQAAPGRLARRGARTTAAPAKKRTRKSA